MDLEWGRSMEVPKRYYQNEYIDGSAVRKIQNAPEYERQEHEEQRRRTSPPVTRRAQREASMDMVSLLILTLAVCATLYVCIDYLIIQSDITLMSKNIATIESDLLELTKKNNAMEESINSSIKLSMVYEIATEDLGMVFANSNQIITYKSNKSDYVRQYSDIPDSTSLNILEKILKK